MKQIIYVTNRTAKSNMGGREQLSALHSQIIRDLIGDGFDSVELDSSAGVWKLLGFINGVSPSSISLVVSRLRKVGARQVFLDGSNLGQMAKGIKKALPNVEILTFFHNCEARFFLGAFKQNKGVRSLGVLVANYLAERLAVVYSDKLICLSKRDSDLLGKVYGRPATHISPIALRDRLPSEYLPLGVRPESFALFVGGVFYANQVGIAWFVKHVVPRITIKTYVVGKGFESLKSELERNGKVEVVGSVDSVSQWYMDSKFVVAPIFDGSGMKTKVAEALMFGRRIIGTPEAFSGYMDVADRAGAVCTTADDFVAAIERATVEPNSPFDPGLRAIYEERYSYSAARNRLAKIMGSNQKLTQPRRMRNV